MTALFRSLYTPALASGSRTRIATSAIRFTSSSSSSSASAPTPPPSAASLLEREVVSPDARNPPSRSTAGTGISDNIFAASEIDKLKPKGNNDPDGFWTRNVPGTAGQLKYPPGDQYSGRSIDLSKGGRSFEHGYRILSGILSRTGVRKDVRDSEYYEKPHVMRNRQKSERHRRRFQEMIRSKVQMVQTIRNRR